MRRRWARASAGRPAPRPARPRASCAAASTPLAPIRTQIPSACAALASADVAAAAAPWMQGLRQDYRAGLFRSVESLAARMKQW
jgi:hypothetical protein